MGMFNANKMKELQSRHPRHKERPWPYIKRLACVFFKRTAKKREGGVTYRVKQKQQQQKTFKGYQSIVMCRLYLDPDSNV